MPFETIVRHCAPTLAGMKIGNLFSFRHTSKEVLLRDIENRNKLLNSKGIYFKILKISDDFALIYVYRLNKLEEALKSCDVIEFLSKYEYNLKNIETTLETLQKHLEKSDFPHEIGVFLGYPLSDIKAFIDDKGVNAKYVGCWKAYTNEEYARKTFEKYKKCTYIYCKKFAEGTDITRLTVAC